MGTVQSGPLSPAEERWLDRLTTGLAISSNLGDQGELTAASFGGEDKIRSVGAADARRLFESGMRASSLFRDLRDDLISELFEEAVPIFVKRGGKVFEKGHMGQVMFVVIKGGVWAIKDDRAPAPAAPAAPPGVSKQNWFAQQARARQEEGRTLPRSKQAAREREAMNTLQSMVFESDVRDNDDDDDDDDDDVAQGADAPVGATGTSARVRHHKAHDKDVTHAIAHVQDRDYARTGSLIPSVFQATMRASRNKTLGPGRAFGTHCVLLNTPHSWTVTAKKDSLMLALHRVQFQEISRRVSRRNRLRESEDQRVHWMQRLPFFNLLAEQKLHRLADFMTQSAYSAGETILKSGEPLPGMFIVLTGTVACKEEGVEVRWYHQGDCFGAGVFLMSDEPHTPLLLGVDVVVSGGDVAECLFLSWADLARAAPVNLVIPTADEDAEEEAETVRKLRASTRSGSAAAGAAGSVRRVQQQQQRARLAALGTSGGTNVSAASAASSMDAASVRSSTARVTTLTVTAASLAKEVHANLTRDILQSAQLFALLDIEEIGALADRGDTIVVGDGETLFEQTEPSDTGSVYVILHGTVHMEGKLNAVQDMTSDRAFGSLRGDGSAIHAGRGTGASARPPSYTGRGSAVGGRGPTRRPVSMAAVDIENLLGDKPEAREAPEPPAAPHRSQPRADDAAAAAAAAADDEDDSDFEAGARDVEADLSAGAPSSMMGASVLSGGGDGDDSGLSSMERTMAMSRVRRGQRESMRKDIESRSFNPSARLRHGHSQHALSTHAIAHAAEMHRARELDMAGSSSSVYLLDGELFGEECLEPGSKHSVTCTTVGTTVLLKLSVPLLRELDLLERVRRSYLGHNAEEAEHETAVSDRRKAWQHTNLDKLPSAFSMSDQFLMLPDMLEIAATDGGRYEAKRLSLLRTITRANLKVVCKLHTTRTTNVFLALHAPTSQLCVVKGTNLERSNEDGMGRFVLTEQSLLAQVESPFVIKLLSAWHESPSSLVALEAALGGSLEHELACLPHSQRGPLGGFSFEACRFLGAGILLGLKHLYELRIVHRDLKTVNILLDHHGYPKLADFGVSKALQHRSSRTSTFVGTPRFMAPEQAALANGNSSGYGIGVDWWAFGVVMYRMATRTDAFGAQRAQLSLDKASGGGGGAGAGGARLMRGGALARRRSKLDPRAMTPEADARPAGAADAPAPLARAVNVGSDGIDSALAAIVMFGERHRHGAAEHGESIRSRRNDPCLRKFNDAQLRRQIEDPASREDWLILANFVADLLHPDASRRLGSNNWGPRSAQVHPLFAARHEAQLGPINWDQLVQRHVPPPLVPRAEDLIVDAGHLRRLHEQARKEYDRARLSIMSSSQLRGGDGSDNDDDDDDDREEDHDDDGHGPSAATRRNIGLRRAQEQMLNHSVMSLHSVADELKAADEEQEAADRGPDGAPAAPSIEEGVREKLELDTHNVMGATVASKRHLREQIMLNDRRKAKILELKRRAEVAGSLAPRILHRAAAAEALHQDHVNTVSSRFSSVSSLPI